MPTGNGIKRRVLTHEFRTGSEPPADRTLIEARQERGRSWRKTADRSIARIGGQDDPRIQTGNPNQETILDMGASKGYSFCQFAIVIYQARFNQRSVGSLEGAKRGAEAGTCGRSLITRRSLVRVQPPLPITRIEAI